MLQIYNNAMISVNLLLIIAISAVAVQKKLRIGAAVLWIYAALSSTNPAFNIMYNPKEYLMPIFLTATKVTAAQSLVLILLVPIFVLFIKPNSLKNILKCYFLIEAILVIFTGETLTLGWNSFSSTMLSLSVFLFIPSRRIVDILMLCVIILGSMMDMSITSVLIYACALTIYLWSEYKKEVSVVLAAGLGLFILISPPELTSGNGRYNLWSDLAMAYIDKLPKILGTGLGTWAWIGPQIQGTKDFLGYGMVHNDFVQVLFEMGFVGLFIFFWALFEAIYNNRRNLNFLIPVSGFCIAMMTYFPLHVVPGQVLFLYYLLYRDRTQAGFG